MTPRVHAPLLLLCALVLLSVLAVSSSLPVNNLDLPDGHLILAKAEETLSRETRGAGVEEQYGRVSNEEEDRMKRDVEVKTLQRQRRARLGHGNRRRTGRVTTSREARVHT